jgi:hypothetical protein
MPARPFGVAPFFILRSISSRGDFMIGISQYLGDF